MFNVKLTKVHGGSNIRTSEVQGTALEPLALNQPFIMVSTPLDSTTDVRYIRTSPVQTITENSDGSVTFATENSIYQLISVTG